MRTVLRRMGSSRQGNGSQPVIPLRSDGDAAPLPELTPALGAGQNIEETLEGLVPHDHLPVARAVVSVATGEAKEDDPLIPVAIMVPSPSGSRAAHSLAAGGSSLQPSTTPLPYVPDGDGGIEDVVQADILDVLAGHVADADSRGQVVATTPVLTPVEPEVNRSTYRRYSNMNVSTDQALCGKLVEVQFGERWFLGRVTRYDPEEKKHEVTFEDGERHVFDMAHLVYRVPEIETTVGGAGRGEEQSQAAESSLSASSSPRSSSGTQGSNQDANRDAQQQQQQQQQQYQITMEPDELPDIGPHPDRSRPTTDWTPPPGDSVETSVVRLAYTAVVPTELTVREDDVVALDPTADADTNEWWVFGRLGPSWEPSGWFPRSCLSSSSPGTHALAASPPLVPSPTAAARERSGSGEAEARVQALERQLEEAQAVAHEAAAAAAEQHEQALNARIAEVKHVAEELLAEELRAAEKRLAEQREEADEAQAKLAEQLEQSRVAHEAKEAELAKATQETEEERAANAELLEKAHRATKEARLEAEARRVSLATKTQKSVEEAVQRAEAAEQAAQEAQEALIKQQEEVQGLLQHQQQHAEQGAEHEETKLGTSALPLPNTTTSRKDGRDTGPSDVEEEWQCLVCTFVNTNATGLACEVCSAARTIENSTLQKMQLDIGDRVEVCWQKDHSSDAAAAYRGTVANFDPDSALHLIHYDDGDSEWHSMTSTRFHHIPTEEERGGAEAMEDPAAPEEGASTNKDSHAQQTESNVVVPVQLRIPSEGKEAVPAMVVAVAQGGSSALLAPLPSLSPSSFARVGGGHSAAAEAKGTPVAAAEPPSTGGATVTSGRITAAAPAVATAATGTDEAKGEPKSAAAAADLLLAEAAGIEPGSTPVANAEAKAEAKGEPKGARDTFVTPVPHQDEQGKSKPKESGQLSPAEPEGSTLAGSVQVLAPEAKGEPKMGALHEPSSSATEGAGEPKHGVDAGGTSTGDVVKDFHRTRTQANLSNLKEELKFGGAEDAPERRKAVKKIAAALYRGSGNQQGKASKAGKALRIAQAVESEIRSTLASNRSGYRKQIRRVASSLSGDANSEFRDKVLDGIIGPVELAAMEPKVEEANRVLEEGGGLPNAVG